MNRHLVINSENNELEYVIDVIEKNKGIEYVLSRSGSECWVQEVRHETVLTILDDGNGVKITPKLGKHIDYARLAELQILLQFMSKKPKSNKLDYKIIPDTSDLVVTV